MKKNSISLSNLLLPKAIVKFCDTLISFNLRLYHRVKLVLLVKISAGKIQYRTLKEFVGDTRKLRSLGGCK